MRLKLPKELSGGLLLSANTFIILFLAFFVQILIARYLGPELLGGYAFAMSFASLTRVLVFMNLGDVLIPLYQKERNDAHFGTGWLLSKTVAILLSAGAALHIVASGRTELSYQILIVVAAYLWSDHEIYSAWCKAEAKLLDFVRVDLGGTLVGLSLRLLVIAMNGSVTALLCTYLIEQVAKSAIAGAHYLIRKRSFLKPIRAGRKEAIQILKRVWPIWTSAILGVAYVQLDQILLGTLLDDPSQLGYYSVAARLIEALNSGATALFVVYLPILSTGGFKELQLHLQRLMDLVVWSCFLVILPLYFLLADTVVFLYGAEYRQAGELASLYLLGLPAFSLATARSAYLYARDLQRLELTLRVVGLVANVGLNIYFIPKYGARAAVLSTISVQWVTSVLANWMLPSLQPIGSSVARATWLPDSYRRLSSWVRNHQTEN